MKRQTFANVWDALEDTQTEAASMTMRSNLLIAIEQRVRSWNVTQAEAAGRLGVTQPRLNDLLRGRIQNFSLEALIDLAAKAGLRVRLDIAADIDWADEEIEVVETAEHAVAKKTAKIVEEVALRKVGTDHVETIRDKLRRQQVEIERVDAQGKVIPAKST